MLCSMGELERHGFDEFEIHQYPKGVSLILKCADWITNKELDVALNYARKIDKNKPFATFDNGEVYYYRDGRTSWSDVGRKSVPTKKVILAGGDDEN